MLNAGLLGSALFGPGARLLGNNPAVAFLFRPKAETPRHTSDVRFGSPKKSVRPAIPAPECEKIWSPALLVQDDWPCTED
jgi:hypothetical protein